MKHFKNIQKKWWGYILAGLVLLTIGNSRQAHETLNLEIARPCHCNDISELNIGGEQVKIQEALLATKIGSLEDLKRIITITYYPHFRNEIASFECPMVAVSQCSGGKLIIAVLESGIDEDDFKRARDGVLWDKVEFALSSPYTVSQRLNIQKIYNLGRRRPKYFGEGDVAFYDLAEATMFNIFPEDFAIIPKRDTTEKGYINTFNHVTAQAFMTSIFSEQLADFVADVHERHNMPELLTGQFTAAQLNDPIDNPLDNYVDLINNEWGQELGKKLKLQFNISQSTEWTPTLLADYLNEVQSYYSHSFGLRFIPFNPESELITRFSDKINVVMRRPPEYTQVSDN